MIYVTTFENNNILRGSTFAVGKQASVTPGLLKTNPPKKLVKCGNQKYIITFFAKYQKREEL